MLMNILIGLVTMAACLALQSWLIVVALRYYVRRNVLGDDPSGWVTFRVLNAVMAVLVLGNCAQLTIWAIVFRILGEFDALEVAVYHSAVNFASLGYGDIVMSERWPLCFGPLEAVNGVLMIGVSTAVLMNVLQDAYQKTKGARRSGGCEWTTVRASDRHGSTRQVASCRHAGAARYRAGSAATTAAVAGTSNVMQERGPEGVEAAAQRTAKELAKLIVDAYRSGAGCRRCDTWTLRTSVASGG
jgi:hypothetical protein